MIYSKKAFFQLTFLMYWLTHLIRVSHLNYTIATIIGRQVTKHQKMPFSIIETLILKVIMDGSMRILILRVMLSTAQLKNQ